MWDMNSINEESRVDFDFKESQVLWRCCWRFALTNAKGSFESGKFTLKITCESGKLFTTGCRLPPKSTNFGTLDPVSQSEPGISPSIGPSRVASEHQSEPSRAS